MILVTGVNGFVGKHLARELSSREIPVLGIGLHEEEPPQSIADLLEDYYKCDITDTEQVNHLPLEKVDGIINLAGLANVGASFDKPELYMEVNVKVLSVLGEGLLKANPAARMIAVSTGALYDPNQPMPLSESSKTIEQGSPYSLSKLAMEAAAKTLSDKGLDCIVVRPFNHIGPGQGLGFLIPDLADKLKRADPQNPTITAGNLKTIRDYSDVRDIAKAYTDLVTTPSLNESLYNVCSGIGNSGEDIVRALCEELGIDFEKLTINTDPSLVRPSDPARIVGDSTRLKNATGWQPTIKLETTVKDIVASLK